MRPTPEQSCTLWLIASWEDSLADSQRDSGEPVTTFSPTITPALPPLPTVAADSRVLMFWSGTRVALPTTVRPTLGYSSCGLPCSYAAGVCSTPAAGYLVYYLEDQHYRRRSSQERTRWPG